MHFLIICNFLLALLIFLGREVLIPIYDQWSKLYFSLNVLTRNRTCKFAIFSTPKLLKGCIFGHFFFIKINRGVARWYNLFDIKGNLSNLLFLAFPFQFRLKAMCLAQSLFKSHPTKLIFPTRPELKSFVKAVEPHCQKLLGSKRMEPSLKTYQDWDR